MGSGDFFLRATYNASPAKQCSIPCRKRLIFHSSWAAIGAIDLTSLHIRVADILRVSVMAHQSLIDDAFSEEIELAKKVHDAMRKVAYARSRLAADAWDQENIPLTPPFSPRSQSMSAPCEVKWLSREPMRRKPPSHRQKSESWKVAQHHQR